MAARPDVGALLASKELTGARDAVVERSNPARLAASTIAAGATFEFEIQVNGADI